MWLEVQKKCHKAILLLTVDFSARCEHKRNWIKLQSKTRRTQRPHSLTSGHEKVVRVEQLKTEQSENAFHRERPSVHKVSIEQLEVASRKLSTLAKHQNQHKTDLYVLQCWIYFSDMKQAQWTPTPLHTPTPPPLPTASKWNNQNHWQGDWQVTISGTIKITGKVTGK